jgi:hypothetical protein
MGETPTTCHSARPTVGLHLDYGPFFSSRACPEQLADDVSNSSPSVCQLRSLLTLSALVNILS